MNALVDSRSFLDVVSSRFAKSRRRTLQVSKEIVVPSSHPDIGVLRRALSSAMHLALPDDVHSLFESIGDTAYVEARGGRGPLSDLVRGWHEYMIDNLDDVRGLRARPVRCLITDEFGLCIGREVVPCTARSLHDILLYDRMRTELGVPMALGRERARNDDHPVRYSVVCFVRVDQRAAVPAVRDGLGEIARTLRDTR